MNIFYIEDKVIVTLILMKVRVKMKKYHLIIFNKQQIDDISKEKSISNSLKQLVVENRLIQSEINNILKDSTINNKESLINDILNKNNKNTYVQTPICIKS